MRFWTVIPLFLLMNFAFCGQEEPPQPNILDVTAETSSGELIESTTLTVDVDVYVMSDIAPASFSIPANRTATISAARTFWSFTPADTTIALGEEQELELTFTGLDPDLLEINCTDAESGGAVPAEFTITLADESVQLSGATAQIELPLTRTFSLHSEKLGWELVPADTTFTLDGATTDIINVRATQVNAPATLHVTAEDGSGAAIEGVQVLLNGEDTGEVTPAELTLISTYEYIVSLQSSSWDFTPATQAVTLDPAADETITFVGEEIGQTTHVVFLEDFSNVGCSGCPGAEANMLEAMAAEGGEDMIAVAFHWNNPTQYTDPFFNYPHGPGLNLEGPNYLRGLFYAVGTSLPRIFIDGTPVGDVDVSTIRDGIQAAKATAATVNMAITRTMETDSVAVDVTGQVLADPGPGPWRLYVVVYESEIDTGTPPGSNGQSLFHNIVRHGNEHDGELGEPVSLTVGEPINFSVKFGPDYTKAEVSNLYALAFIQNPDTKVILDTVVESNGGH
ncbi:MAG: hypothetical protein GY835_17460 [bacterium]|nr:hypothetical protein [bacterium]